MTATSPSKPDLKRIAVLVILGCLAFGLYYNSLGNPPTNWDDPALFQNPYWHDLNWDNLKHVLSFQSNTSHQPVRDISYMIDFTLWKDQVILGLHLHSILLYYFMLIAVWMFLLELFRALDVAEGRAFLWSTMAAIIYAVHPVHVESVTWLFARKEPLLGLFTFLSLWAFIKARTGPAGYYAASVVFLILAMLSQPAAFMIPAVMLVIDVALQSHKPDAAYWKKRALLLIPMFLLMIPLLVRLLLMMQTAGGVKPYHGGSFWTNLLAVSQIFISYIGLIGFNLNYVADYPIRLYTSLGQWQAWVFLVLNALLLAGAVLAFVRKRYIYAVFMAWFYIFILPVSHILPLAQTMTDRYALIPSLSWCVLLGWLLTMLWEKRLHSTRLSPDFPRLMAMALFSIVVLSYASLTIRQNTIWGSSYALWENTVARYPNSSSGNVNLSVIYIHLGKYEEAQELCIAAIKEIPYDYLAISNLALAQTLMGQYDNAIHNYQTALELRPDLEKARLGLANAYWSKHDLGKAYETYTAISQGSPNTMSPPFGDLIRLRLAYAAWKLGKPGQPRQDLDSLAGKAGLDPGVAFELGQVYTSMGENRKAISIYERLRGTIKAPDRRREIDEILRALRAS